MGNTVCISKERYEYLIECERLVDMEFEERLSERFIKEVKESERDYKEGRFKRFKTMKEAKRYLNTGILACGNEPTKGLLITNPKLAVFSSVHRLY